MNLPIPSHITADSPLEALLLEMQRYGKPRVAHTGSGWTSSVEMYVTSAGVDCTIRSDFGFKEPRPAAQQCYERLLQTIEDIKKGNHENPSLHQDAS